MFTCCAARSRKKIRPFMTLAFTARGSIRSWRWPKISRAKISRRSANWSSAGNFASVPVIGITGTNGKTTTTELIAQMLNACGQRTVACGNIGKPLVEAARENDDLAVLTVEVSSFQLETIREFHPEISVWLNFAPDHLDRYRFDPRIPRGQAPHFRKPDALTTPRS